MLILIAFLAICSLSGSGDMEQNTEAQEQNIEAQKENSEAKVENTENDVEAGTEGVKEEQRCVADCGTVSQCQQFRTFLAAIAGATTHQVDIINFFLEEGGGQYVMTKQTKLLTCPSLSGPARDDTRVLQISHRERNLPGGQILPR